MFNVKILDKRFVEFAAIMLDLLRSDLNMNSKRTKICIYISFFIGYVEKRKTNHSRKKREFKIHS